MADFVDWMEAHPEHEALAADIFNREVSIVIPRGTFHRVFGRYSEPLQMAASVRFEIGLTSTVIHLWPYSNDLVARCRAALEPEETIQSGHTSWMIERCQIIES